MIKVRISMIYPFVLCLLCLSLAMGAAEVPLRISVYATAGDVLRYLSSAQGVERAHSVLQQLQITRIFLEGRRGDEYVPPETLRTIRAYFSARGIDSSGGIATVPGKQFGTRQSGQLSWLNWESEKTRREISAFFSENAPIFGEIIVDDFYCTADTSPASDAARGGRPWSDYRRELLVSLIDPMIVKPARAAQPSVRLIIKYPQWYDRFHLFGYDPPRMSPLFDQVWVGTEVRNPTTQRMGFVQPTEGYINFRWFQSIAGDKVRGAWFDHIESTAQNFVDQAYQSVLAGARELTLFHLGDLMEGHPGDKLLQEKLPELTALAARMRGWKAAGAAYYKPPGSDAGENLYLMDYLAMIGLPVLPQADYPRDSKVAFMGVQAAADPALLDKLHRHLATGATLALTPALLRKLGPEGMRLAGVDLTKESEPAAVSEVRVAGTHLRLAEPLDIDKGVRAAQGRVRIEAQGVPIFTSLRQKSGTVFMLNVRTFSEQDFVDVGELLLAPKPRGLSSLPALMAREIRKPLLAGLGVRFDAPAGVGLYLFQNGGCAYSFLDKPATASRNGKKAELPAHGLVCW